MDVNNESSVVDRDTLREEWLQALESGEYQQGVNNLCRDDHYCCLGIACEILFKHGLLARRTCSSNNRLMYGPVNEEIGNGFNSWRGDILPERARVALGLRSQSGASRGHCVRSLLAMNDDGVPFTAIAATIRANMDLYFE